MAYSPVSGTSSSHVTEAFPSRQRQPPSTLSTRIAPERGSVFGSASLSRRMTDSLRQRVSSPCSFTSV